MIKAEGLTRHFGDLVALEELSFEVEEGEIFGLLGPNGAGKTTTVRLLTSLISPSQGRASVAGYDTVEEADAVRRHVGILTETPGLYGQLSAEENLRLFAELHELDEPEKAIERYLRLVNLWERKDHVVDGFSKGMRQKLAIVRALLHEPKVVFLDEPTSALDPESARTVRDFIDELREKGRTIILCTHNLDEADKLCDRIAILRKRLLRVDKPEKLRQDLYGSRVLFRLQSVNPKLIEKIEALEIVGRVEQIENSLRISLKNPQADNPQVIRTLVENGASVQFVEEEEHSLEEVYFDLLEQH